LQYNYDKIDRLIDAKKKETGSSTFFSKCGLSRGQYALWKKGEQTPTKEEIARLAEGLGVNPGDLYLTIAAPMKKQHATTKPLPAKKVIIPPKEERTLAYYSINRPLHQLPVLEIGQWTCPFCNRELEDLLHIEHQIHDHNGHIHIRRSMGRGCPRCKTIVFDANMIREIKRVLGSNRVHTFDAKRCKTPKDITQALFMDPLPSLPTKRPNMPLPYANELLVPVNLSEKRVYVELHAQKCHCEQCNEKYGLNTMKDTTAIFNLASGDTVSLTVEFCQGCGKYFLNHEVYLQYCKDHPDLMINISYCTKMGDLIHSEFYDDDTILSRCGYTVKQGTSREYRHRILRFIIDEGLARKYEVIELISSFIYRHATNPKYKNACRCWEEDIMYVSDYKKTTQEKIFNPEIKQTRIIRR